MPSTIAIVDDDENFSAAIKEFLEAQGFKVWRALDPSQFYALSKENVPDLIILDMQMTAGGGPAVVKLVRGQKETANTPIILSSGMPIDRQKDWFKDAGKMEFMQKPLDYPTLLKFVKQFLPGDKAA